MSETIQKTIDIDKVLRDKMGDKAKWVPKPAVSWLKKTIHQDRVNAFLWESRELKGTLWLKACVDYLEMTLQLEGLENLPDKNDGKLYTFVSNHPLGGIDGVALGSIIGEHYDGNFRYLVNDLLMNLPGLAPVCIPINKTGKQSRDFPAMVEAGFKSDHHMLMFPAGLCSRKQPDGQIRDLDWKKTFVTKGVETHRDVVPIHFGGQNSERFYNIANWCKRLGIKFNLAMLLLPDEMYKAQHGTFKVVFGDPIPPEIFDSSRTPYEWAQWVREKVYEL